MSSNRNRESDNLYAPAWVSADQTPDELHSEILPRLFQGGTADEEWDVASSMGLPDQVGPNPTLSDEFDAVVTLFAWSRPGDWGMEELRYAFYDAAQALSLGQMAASSRPSSDRAA